MFEDADLPDFDSMTQEELIEWLEHLAQRHDAAASELIDDYADSPAAADDNAPADQSPLDDDDNATTASLNWLDEIIAAHQPDDVPDTNDLSAKPQSAGNPHELPGGDDGDDPLDWLKELDADDAAASVTSQAAGQLGYDYPKDFDETWEDDEALDDLEDESMYSLDAEASASFLESLLDLEDRETEGAEHTIDGAGAGFSASP